jgi:hypothetical protein
VLSRAARLQASSNLSDLGGHANDLPPLQGLAANTSKDSGQSPQRANNSPAGGDAKVQNFKNEEVQARRSVAIEEEELLQQEAKLQANFPQAPPPPTASPTTAPSISQPALTLPEDSTVVTTRLGGEVSMIGAYFAQQWRTRRVRSNEQRQCQRWRDHSGERRAVPAAIRPCQSGVRRRLSRFRLGAEHRHR